jgi:multidrug efflux pump subunit AcrA (membrane-fusion protein)
LHQAKVDLSRTSIKAPFSGRIAQLNVAIGERVNTGDTLFTIYDFSNLEVRAQLPNKIIKQVRLKLKKGQKLIAKAMVDDEIISFELVRLSGEVRNDSGGIDGLFRLTDNKSLLLGTFVELSLTLPIQPLVIALPFSTLYGLEKVYRIVDGYLEAIHVKRVGEIVDDNNVLLLVHSDELKQGDQVLRTQLPNAMTGLRVEAVN